MRRIERIVYRKHVRLIIWRRSVRIPCGHYYSVWDGCDNGIGKDCDWRLLRLRARIRSVVARESFVGHIRFWTMGQLIILLLMARGYTTLWEQTPLHYGEACPPAEPISQLASNSSLEYTSHHTPNIMI